MIVAGTQKDRIGANPRANGTRRRKQAAQPSRRPVVTRLLLGVVLAAVVVTVLRSSDELGAYVNRPVSKVRMENHWQRVAESEIRQVLAPFMGAGFFNFDVSGLKQQLEDQPWIAQAAVKRVWPDSVAIHLQEELAIARWGDSGVLNQAGQVFHPDNAGELSSLPVLSGPQGSQLELMQRYQQISELLYSSGLRLTALELSARGSWQLMINEEYQVVVGRDQVMERLQRFLDFYNAEPAMRSALIESVDLRYDNGVAVEFTAEEVTELAVR